MTSEEIIEVYLSGEFEHVFATQEEFELLEAEDEDEYAVINDNGIFPVEAVYFPLDRTISTIDIKKENGDDFGLIALLSGKIVNDFQQLSLSDFLAYLHEVPKDIFGIAGYTFQKDYFISSEGTAHEYREKYWQTAPIWGQYTHLPPPNQTARTLTRIVAVDNIAVPSAHHREAFSRYVHAKNPLERYLRLYHCIELLFDVIVVLKIKQLGSDIRDFSTIMSQHGRSELDILRAIALQHLTDPESIASGFVKVAGFLNTSTKVFQDFNKDGNPLSPKGNPSKWQPFVDQLALGRYNEADLRGASFLKASDGYAEFVAKVSSYWIYRIRCSIAHSRVGEFILEDRDQDFITEFAEPLLLSFVMQVFRSQGLHDLLS